MHNRFFICLLGIVFFSLLCPRVTLAQTSIPSIPLNVVHHQLEISTEVTTVLLFAAPIIPGGWDKGHPDISTKTVAGVSNVLRVKAESDSFPPSNLTVFTTDGMVYSFQVSYRQIPDSTIYDFTSYKGTGPAMFFTHRMNDAAVMTHSMIVSATPSHRSRPVTTSVGDMKMRLTGLYLKEGVMFIKLRLANNSAITYDVDFTRCYIRDRVRKKRTSAMEKKVLPLQTLYSPDSSIPPQSSVSLVMALPKFTIADSKYFCVEVFEQNGDRVLQLRFKGKHLLKARYF